MFRNINQRQKQDEHPTDENVREENLLSQQQPQLQPMGNEGADVKSLAQMIKEANADTGNEFLAGLQEDGDLSVAGDNINNENNIKENLINNIASEEDDQENRKDLDGSLLNGLGDASGKIINKIIAEAPKDGGGGNKEQKKAGEGRPKAAENAVQDIFPDMMKEIQDFYKDPDPDQQEGDQDALSADHELNTSMVVHAPKKHQKKKKKSDLKKAAAPMEMIKGLNIAVQKLPARKKTGWWSRLLTGTAWYAGKTIGKLFNWLGNLFIMPFFDSEKRSVPSANPRKTPGSGRKKGPMM